MSGANWRRNPGWQSGPDFLAGERQRRRDLELVERLVRGETDGVVFQLMQCDGKTFVKLDLEEE